MWKKFVNSGLRVHRQAVRVVGVIYNGSVECSPHLAGGLRAAPVHPTISLTTLKRSSTTHSNLAGWPPQTNEADCKNRHTQQKKKLNDRSVGHRRSLITVYASQSQPAQSDSVNVKPPLCSVWRVVGLSQSLSQSVTREPRESTDRNFSSSSS